MGQFNQTDQDAHSLLVEQPDQNVHCMSLSENVSDKSFTSEINILNFRIIIL